MHKILLIGTITLAVVIAIIEYGLMIGGGLGLLAGALIYLQFVDGFWNKTAQKKEERSDAQ